MAFIGSVASFRASNGRAARCVTKMSEKPAVAEEEMTEDQAWGAFAQSVAAERSAMIEGNKRAIMNRYEMWQDSVSEKEMLTFFGQLKNNYARRHGMKDYNILSTQGIPLTDLPGEPYATGIGALDFLRTEEPMAVLVGMENFAKPTLSSTDAAAQAALEAEAEEEEVDLEALEAAREELVDEDYEDEAGFEELSPAFE